MSVLNLGGDQCVSGGKQSISVTHRSILTAGLLLTSQHITDHGLGIHNIAMNPGSGCAGFVWMPRRRR